MTPEEATEKLSHDEFWKNKPTLNDVQACIKAGADLTKQVSMTVGDDKKVWGSRPLAYCAVAYLPDAIPMLIKAGMEIDQDLMEGSYYLSSTAIAPISYEIKSKGFKALLDNGGKFIIDPGDSDKLVKIWYFEMGSMNDEPNNKSAEDQRQKLKLLFEHGIDPDKTEYIFDYSKRGWEKATQIILNCGGHIDLRNSEGDTPLTSLGKKIAKEYREGYYTNDDRTEEERNEQTALSYMRGVTILLSKGADMSLPDSEGVSFEKGPASKVPFVAEMIKTYHEKGKDAVVDLSEKMITKLNQGKYKNWPSCYKWYPMSIPSSQEGLRERLGKSVEIKSKKGRIQAKKQKENE